MPDLVLYNGIIHTMTSEALKNRQKNPDCSNGSGRADKAFPTAIAIKGHLIEAVGTDEEILALAGTCAGTDTSAPSERMSDYGSNDRTGVETSDCVMIDLQGKCVLPGFTDSHCHVLHTGIERFQVPLNGVRSVEEITRRVRAFIDEHQIPAGTWVQGAGYNHNLFSEKRQPTRYDLDQISQEHPILLDRICGHIGAANSLALQITGFDRDDLQFEGGGGVLRDENGIPTGVIVETALDRIHDCVPKPSPGQVKEAIKAVFKEAASYGVTAMHTDDTPVSDLAMVMDAYRQLQEEGLACVRIWEEVEAPRPAQLREFLDTGLRTGSGNRFFKIGNIKLITDGSIGAHTAYMREDYSDCPGDRGVRVYTDEELCEMAHLAHEAGMQLAFHAIGDGALEQCIKAIMYARSFDQERQDTGRPGVNTEMAHFHGDLRDRIVHCQFADEKLLDLMAENHICADIQPPFVATDYPIVRDRVGSREYGSYAWKSMLRRGIPLGGGSDTPVENFNPIEGIHCAVNRTDPENLPAGGWHPEEKLSVWEALQIYTTGGAYLAMEEDVRGTIEPGRYADLAILDRDITAVAPEEIRTVRNVMTVMDGKIVYCADDAAAE